MTQFTNEPGQAGAQLLLAGELGNSNASDPQALRDLWPKLAALQLNTVLVPVYWELLEPTEGSFDFTLLDEALHLARHYQQHLVLLWFGSWKNSMSCYVPDWVKRTVERFPRARLRDGSALEMLSAFSKENLAADSHAFARLMAHVRERDALERTVVLVQVENEVGMLGQARDTCREANAAFAQDVPTDLLEAIENRGGKLARRTQARQSGSTCSWTDVFGVGLQTEELFQAYYYAKYLAAVAAAGKREYDLPMFVNAALNRPGTHPGEYPSAGPLPHLFDVWKTAAPTLDFLAPDIYLPDFAAWCQRYACSDNRLFIPEATNGVECAVHALYAIGACQAMGFSPFAVEAIDPSQSMLPDCYRALRFFSSEIITCRDRGAANAVLLTRDEPMAPIELGGYRLNCAHHFTWEWSGPGRFEPSWPKTGALILATEPDTFLVIGTGIIITFSALDELRDRVGILQIDELGPNGNEFVRRRRLNGDESHQGRHLCIGANSFGVQSIRLYQYR